MSKTGIGVTFIKNQEEKPSPCQTHDRETELEEAKNRLDEVKKRVFESGAHRDSNDGKSFVHNILGYTRLRFGYHMAIGAKRYGDGNWLKGMPSAQYLESVDRHLAMYIDGDRTEDHLSAIIFGIQGCMINEKEKITSDYYFKLTNNEVKQKTT